MRLIIRAAVAALIAAFAGAGVALADHGNGNGDHGAKAAERLFTLQPDPAANPEGVAVSRHAFYVSDTGSGAIYSGSLGSATVSPFIPGASGKSAVGLKVAFGRLYVAGGSTGAITVYDLASKQAIATFDTGAGGFLNDLVVTRHGDVYVTDSNRPKLWHVTEAQVKAGGGTPQGLDVSSGITFGSGFNLNGIVARGERKLVVVQTNTGKLFRIQLSQAGDAIASITAVDGVSVPGGDGMLLDQGRLVVVQGGPPAQLSFVKLRHGATSGQVVGTRTSASLKGPSTIARDGAFYLIVNADFANSAKPFTVLGLPRRGNDDLAHQHKDDRGHDNGHHDAGDDNGKHNGDDNGHHGDDNGHHGDGNSGHGGGHDD
jgi:Cu-Zn family superoxide dismutase